MPQVRLKRFLFVLLIPLYLNVCSSALANQITLSPESSSNYKPLQLNDSTSSYNINTYAHIVHDPQKLWSPNTFITSPDKLTQLTSAPYATVENTGQSYWMIFTLVNRTPIDIWKLKFAHSRTDKIDVLVFSDNAIKSGSSRLGETQVDDSNVVHLHGGLNSSLANREIYSLGHTFNLALAPNRVYTVVIRAESMLFESKLFVDLMSEQTYRLHSRGAELAVLCTLGIMFALTLYNLFLSIGTRDLIYLLYSLYGASFTLSWAAYFGFIWEVTGYTDPSRYLMNISYMGYLLFLLMFTVNFLQLNHYSANFAKLFRLLITISVLVICITPWASINTIFNIFWVLILPSVILCLTGAYYVYFKCHYRPARYLALGYTLLTLCTAITWLSISDIVPYSTTLAPIGQQADSPAPTTFILASAAIMLLLSMGLADRIAKLQAEKQAAEESAQIKSTFLAIMSHEIRTPLNGMLSMIKLLSKTHLNHHQQTYINTIAYSGNALLTLLNDLLDYARMEHKPLEFESIEFEPKLLIDSILLLMSARAAEKGLSLKANIQDEIPRTVTGDPNRLRQILLNLVSNAIKFTEYGSVTIEATLVQATNSTAKIRFAVIDTGIGIPKPAQDSIFDMFTQANPSIVRRFGGSGLGLTICWRLVTGMGGELVVNSDENTGSKFTFTLPFTTTIPSLLTASQSGPALNYQTISSSLSLHILLVDDVAINRIAVKGLLECEGHRVSTANTGRHTLELLTHNTYDLILMDINMPDMDGFETTQYIRQLPDKIKAHTPVIALTANTEPTQEQDYHLCSFQAVLNKPINTDRLNTIIRTMFTNNNSHVPRLPTDPSMLIVNS